MPDRGPWRTHRAKTGLPVRFERLTVENSRTKEDEGRIGQEKDRQMRRLYHLPLSPYCRKIRLVLAEKRIEVELMEEKPWERRMDFLRMNPAGQVPVLRIDDLVLADSGAIFEYLEETCPEPPLLPANPAGRAEARRLTAWFDDKFHNEVTANLLYERVNRKLSRSGYPDSEKIKAGMRNIKYHLDYIGWLMDHRRWLAGDQLTIADFAAAAQLSCLDYIGDVDWTRSAGLQEWYAKIKSRPAFRSILADLVPGFSPPQHYADLDF
jgi:glutathione S-transferase